MKNDFLEFFLNGEYSSAKQIPAGVPQGSILSPTLYNIFTTDIPKFLSHSDIAFFADDTAILSKSKQKVATIKKLQQSLKIFFSYLEKWKISPNLAKTQLIFFPFRYSKKLIPSEPCSILSSTPPISWVKEVKYLGFILDYKLNFRSHTEATLNKCAKYRNTLYPLICRNSKLNIKNKIAVYKQIFRPIITYSIPQWYSCAQSHKTKMCRFETKTLKMILNMKMRTATHSL